jgi:hypothetical protein
MKRFIPTAVHGILDYMTGLFLSTWPLYMKGLEKEKTENNIGKIKAGPEKIIPMAMGVSAGLYSLFTKYEMGAVKKIPMKVHLALDAAGGLFMVATPWIFGFYKKTWAPFVAIGAFELSAAMFTRLKPGKIYLSAPGKE